MSQTTREFKQELEKARELLKTLGDEIRVKVHLAGMDAKDVWAELSREAEKASHAASEYSREALDDLIKRMKGLAHSFEARSSKPEAPPATTEAPPAKAEATEKKAGNGDPEC